MYYGLGCLHQKLQDSCYLSLAMYKVSSSGLKVTPFVVDPCGAVGYKDTVNVSITFFEGKSITETEIVICIGNK